MRYLFLFAITIATFSSPISAVNADVVLTAGTANGGNNNFFNWAAGGFYTFDFNSCPSGGGVFIDSVQINLNASGGTAVWDFDQTNGGNFAGFFSGSGIAAGDVTFTPNFQAGVASGSLLTIDFDPGTFGVGDQLVFNGDTDGGSGVSGTMFSNDGASLTVFKSNGLSETVLFADIGNNQSRATAFSTIPEPSSTLLAGLTTIGILYRRRRKR